VGGGGLSNLTLQCFILLCGQCKKIFRSSSFQLFIHSSSSTLMMKLLLTCKRIKKDNRNVMRDLWGKGKGSRKSIWNFHSCPFLLFIHTDNNNNMSMANVAWWRIPKLLLPHTCTIIFGGGGGGVRARCCKPFENSFVTTYGIIEDVFELNQCTKVRERQVRSMHKS